MSIIGFPEFIRKLTNELFQPLPGMEAQLRMSSLRRSNEISNFKRMNEAIKSSVLIFLYPERITKQTTFVVTLRSTYDGIHSGQISLPGGRFEFEDENFIQTALRETKEELGISPSKVNIIGQLSELYIPPSNYLVHPFIGFSNEFQVFIPQPKEVAQIIEIPVHSLLNEQNVIQKKITIGDINFIAPSFFINGTTIWGATAMILNEFKEVLKRIES